ncbi:unnamed protein product [Rangifer tarandus platyrhynchus]|uniref:Uncharacterized protein n=1 Tax=Rangifer tarandus platyrhynchus TaxID=3082113 RepID=A0ABN9A124_RANTA|nr:unnamed protein product [Rangifer tarandus platyrhynchus]
MLFFIFTFAVASWKTDLKFLPTCSFPQLSGAGIPAPCRATSPRAPHALQRRAAPGDSAARACPHLTRGLLSGHASGRWAPQCLPPWGRAPTCAALHQPRPQGSPRPWGLPPVAPTPRGPRGPHRSSLEDRPPGRGWTCARPPHTLSPTHPPSLKAPGDLLCLFRRRVQALAGAAGAPRPKGPAERSSLPSCSFLEGWAPPLQGVPLFFFLFPRIFLTLTWPCASRPQSGGPGAPALSREHGDLWVFERRPSTPLPTRPGPRHSGRREGEWGLSPCAEPPPAKKAVPP